MVGEGRVAAVGVAVRAAVRAEAVRAVETVEEGKVAAERAEVMGAEAMVAVKVEVMVVAKVEAAMEEAARAGAKDSEEGAGATAEVAMVDMAATVGATLRTAPPYGR